MSIRLTPGEGAGVFAVLIFLVLWLLAIYGYIANIVKLVGMAYVDSPNIIMAILRAVGIFIAPVGVVMGFL